MRNSKPRQWHRELKNLTKFGGDKSDEIIVDSIKEFSKQEQAELIADKFAEVSQEYDEIRSENIDIPKFSGKDIPEVSESDVIEALKELDSNKSNVKDDIPAKI